MLVVDRRAVGFHDRQAIGEITLGVPDLRGGDPRPRAIEEQLRQARAEPAGAIERDGSGGRVGSGRGLACPLCLGLGRVGLGGQTGAQRRIGEEPERIQQQVSE